MAHIARLPLDAMPFMCFIGTLLWLQNFPSFAQAELLPTHVWLLVTFIVLVVMQRSL